LHLFGAIKRRHKLSHFSNFFKYFCIWLSALPNFLKQLIKTKSSANNNE
jgi:hypothetical protein